jgi:hypothetical protein
MNKIFKWIFLYFALFVGSFVTFAVIFFFTSNTTPFQQEDKFISTFTDSAEPGMADLAHYEELASKYFEEREACFLNESEDVQDEYEYRCSIVDLGVKYYDQDPEGAISLCLFTEKILLYKQGEGILTKIPKEDFPDYQIIETFAQYSINKHGNYQITQEGFDKQWEFCKNKIENSIRYAELAEENQ